MLNQFSNISCYEEFEIQCALMCISKIDVLKEFGHKIDNYYFFVSNDGIFNWFDFEGNHIEDPGTLKDINRTYIPKTITKCVIPNSVTYIDFEAFAYCISLKEITIPNSVTSINDAAFFGCESLTSITIPNNITSISYAAFSHCESLTSITIPNSVTDIGDEAFRYCKSLTSITIPDSVTDIGELAFFVCDSLKEVIFKGKTLDEVKRMKNYPFRIKDESIIKCELC